MKQDEKLGLVSSVLKMIDKYGYVRIICACFMILCISYTTYMALNPEIIFDHYTQYLEEAHERSFNYRMNSTPIIETLLDKAVIETDAKRAFIIEMHNGKTNSTGLSFNYGSMTYEALNESVESVKEDYADFSLDRFPLATTIYREGYWGGSVNDLQEIDKRLSLRILSNEAQYIVLVTINGIKSEIGFLGFTFEEKLTKEEEKYILASANRYSAKISPYLDGEKAKSIK